MADSASAAGDAPPKQKRSFFKKPSWKQKADIADDDDPTAMFDGSKQTFSAIMEERERARIKKLQEQEESARKRELEAARRGKRRKVAHEEGYLNKHEDHDSVRRAKGKDMSPGQSPSLCSSPTPPPQPDSRSLSARYEAVAREPKVEPRSAVVIDLGDSESDENVQLPAKESPKLAAQPEPTDLDEEIDESDPEIREIIRETRRKQRLAREQNAAHEASAVTSGTRYKPDWGAVTGGSTPRVNSAPDPPVQIFITSRIPDTRPLIVTRRLSQRLQEVRQAWCKRQGFDQEMTASIFFTFKGRKLFDVATCRSLGLVADAFGHVRMKDNLDWDENDSKITIEAVTSDIFNENAREAQRQREPGPEPEFEPEPEQKRTKIIIRTKDFGDAKFTCGPETTFEKLATSSVYRLKIPAGKRPLLLFDGERLEPSGTMAELEDFEDGDALEMHFD